MPKFLGQGKRGKAEPVNAAKKANVAAAPQRNQPSTKRNLTKESDDEEGIESDK